MDRNISKHQYTIENKLQFWAARRRKHGFGTDFNAADLSPRLLKLEPGHWISHLRRRWWLRGGWGRVALECCGNPDCTQSATLELVFGVPGGGARVQLDLEKNREKGTHCCFGTALGFTRRLLRVFLRRGALCGAQVEGSSCRRGRGAEWRMGRGRGGRGGRGGRAAHPFILLD